MTKKYKVRYSVENWNKPVPLETRILRPVAPGIKVSQTAYGYTDILFLASIIIDGDEAPSVLLLDSEDQNKPSRRVLELVRDAINHHLEHHTE